MLFVILLFCVIIIFFNQQTLLETLVKNTISATNTVCMSVCCGFIARSNWHLLQTDDKIAAMC